jgi:hypothetical protein
VLELETVSLGQLKRHQLACYANLYVRNRRLLELARLVVGNRAVGWEMLRSAASRTMLEAVRRVRLRGDRPARSTMTQPSGTRLRTVRQDGVGGRQAQKRDVATIDRPPS